VSAVDENEGAPKRNKDWVQDWQVTFVKLVYDAAKTGVFKGRACAQAVLTYYAFNLAIYDSAPRGFRRGYVMPGCTYPAAVAQATSYTPKAVRDANIWLHQQRFIEIEHNGTSISLDQLGFEDERLKLLAEEGQRQAPELKVGPRFRKPRRAGEAEIGHEPEVIEPQVPIDRTSGSITEEPNRTSGSTYSSGSSLYYSESHRTEPPAAALDAVGKKDLGEEGKTAGADVGEQDLAYILNLGKDRPALPDNGLHWFIRPEDRNYRPAVGRSRPKAGEILFEGTEADLLDKYGPHYTGPAWDVDDREDVLLLGGGGSARPQRGSSHDNHFWMGVSKTGDPYFTRASTRPRRRDERQVKLTADEARQLLTLKGAEHLKHRQMLQGKYQRRAA
jgi:hypothetical protein